MDFIRDILAQRNLFKLNVVDALFGLRIAYG